jgi:hypothetical protein
MTTPLSQYLYLLPHTQAFCVETGQESFRTFQKTGQTSLIEISDSIATFCTESDDEGQCYSYTFSGNVQVGDEPVQAMVGESSASSYLYTQTSPVAPALVKFDLAFDGVTYNAEAEYWGETNYGGAIRQNADAYSFTLAKNP